MSDVFIANLALSAEQFDREVVVIDIMRGVYFSLRGAAVDLWSAYQRPLTDETVIASFQPLSAADEAQLRSALKTMVAHGLLLAQTGVGAEDLPTAGGSLRFELPLVEMYSDLAELIAIDPVHEVDETEGWPVRPGGLPDATA